MKSMIKQFFFIALALIVVAAISNPQAFAVENKKTEPVINIVGGDDADIDDYPWQISIHSIDENGNIISHSCGGSIIDPYWILTAAHCVLPKAYKRQKIIAEITNLSDAWKGQIIEISDYMIHPLFNNDSLTNDIALLRLSMPIDTSKMGASVIRFLTPNEEQDGLIAPGIMATITGWGTTEYRGDSPDNLQVGELPIISITDANLWFEEASDGMPEVKEGMLPSGFEEGGVSGCHGDSGGPFVVKDDSDNWVLAGITSWGDVCGGAKQPAVYTRVPYYYDWIIDNSGVGLNENPTEPDFVDIVKLNLNENVYVCDDEVFFGDILIRNFGKNDLDNFVLTVKIGSSIDDIIESKEILVDLSPALPPKGSKRLDLPNILPDDYGDYILIVSVSQPNDKNVEIENGSTSVGFSFIEPVVVNANFDLKAINEVEWVIFDLATYSIVKSGVMDASQSNSQVQDAFCLPEGDYQFYVSGYGSNGSFQVSINSEGEEYILAESENLSYEYVMFSIPFVPESNLSLYYQTAITSDSLFICENSQIENDASFFIRNTGTLIAEEILLRITINGVETDVLFDSKLFSYNSLNYPVKTNNLEIGTNVIKAEIIDYNNYIDDKTPADNIIEEALDIISVPEYATLEMRPDDYYFYFSWKILNSSKEVVMSHRFDQPSNYSMDLCLPEDCYTFLPDDWGIGGIEQDTAIILRDTDGEIIFAIKGSDFVSSKSINFCNTVTSVEEFTNNELVLFPNPATDNIIIRGMLAKSEIKIFDVIGNLRFNKNNRYVTNETMIDISSLENGIYFIQIISGDRVISRKFSVIR